MHRLHRLNVPEEATKIKAPHRIDGSLATAWAQQIRMPLFERSQQERSESREDAQEQQESSENLQDATRKSTIRALLTTGLNMGQISNTQEHTAACQLILTVAGAWWEHGEAKNISKFDHPNRISTAC
jgi:hypothetical protein